MADQDTSLNLLAWILKRVYSMRLWKNPDGTVGASVEFTKSTEAVEFEDLTLEWLLREVRRSLIAVATEGI